MNKQIKSPLQIAIDFFNGDQTRLAAAIDPTMSSMNITNWKTRGVPAKRFMAIQKATKKRVTVAQCYEFYQKSVAA